MRLRLEARNATVVVDGGHIESVGAAMPATDAPALTLRIPDGDVRAGFINAHDHLHRNHYGRLGHPPYADAYQWGRDIHERDAEAIACGRERSRVDALHVGAWKNLFSGVTTVVHHDAWEPAFDDGFPLRVVRVAHAHSLQFERNDNAWRPGSGAFAVHLAEGVNRLAADEVRELDARGLVNAALLAVHAVGVDDDGVKRLRNAGAAIVWCPESNLFLFGRTAPATLLADGIDVLLGTDSRLTGSASLLDELRVAGNTGRISDARLLDGVGAVAARRLGLPMPKVETGARADLVVLRRSVFDATLDDVALVVANGELRVADPALYAQLGALLPSATLRTWNGTARFTWSAHEASTSRASGLATAATAVSDVESKRRESHARA